MNSILNFDNKNITLNNLLFGEQIHNSYSVSPLSCTYFDSNYLKKKNILWKDDLEKDDFGKDMRIVSQYSYY